jgi:hypothetical protein
MSAVVGLCLSLAGQDVAGPEFLRFEFSREKVRNRVTADAQLRNGLAVDLDGARLTITYWDGDREVRVSNTLHLARIAAGAVLPVKVETELVEKFDRFEVVLVSGDRRFTYMGTDLGRPPELLKAPPARLEASLAGETRPTKFPGDLVLQAAVRNVGVSKASEHGLLVLLLDAAGRPVHAAWVRPGGDLDPATEDVLQATLPDVPDYASARVSAACVVADVPVPPDPIGASSDVEIGRCRLARLSDGAVRVTGMLRNGRSGAVKGVEAGFRLGGKTHVLRIPETLRAGALRPFEFHVAGAGKVEEYTYSVAYGDAADPKDEPAPRLPLARRVSTRRLSAAEAGAAPSASPTVELRGLRWVKGAAAGKKGGADIAFLRLAVRDRAGKPSYPVGELSATVNEAGKAHPVARRAVVDESWGTDVDELGAGKARPESVAYDALTGELWVGLVRPDKPTAPLKLGVTLTLAGWGTWEWSGLDEPFQTVARPPDRAR